MPVKVQPKAGEKGNKSKIFPSVITKSSKKIFTKNPEAAPVMSKEQTSSSSSKTQSTHGKNTLDNFSPMDNSWRGTPWKQSTLLSIHSLWRTLGSLFI